MALKPMSRKTPGSKRPVEQYDHKGKKRANNPPVGLVDAKSDAAEGKKIYAYDPHLDPTLVWAGKAERTSFEIPTVSLHVHERIDPRSIIETVRKKNGSDYEQLSLFNSKTENPPLREAIEFYKHAHNWSNRLVAGDSLLVMNSLLEKEGMAGQVQMVYFDPPYGIKYGSNFQPFVNKRDVKDGKDEDLTAEPEMVKAFRDTWELGLHSYLSRSHINLCVADSTWEAQAAYELDHNQSVAAWAKNDHLGFEIAYIYAGIFHKYRPDYLIRLTSGTNLVVETKGQNTPQDETKRRYLVEWVKAVNEHGGFGKWKSDRCLNPSDLPTVIHIAAQQVSDS